MARGLSISDADKFAGFVNQQCAMAIGALDTKASLIIGLATGGVLYLSNKFGIDPIIRTFMELTGSDFSFFVVFLWYFEILLFFVYLFFGLSIIFCVWCIFPRVSDQKKSIVFFKNISSYKSPDEYAEAVILLSPQERVIAILNDTHALAKISTLKLRYAEWATYFLIWGIVFLAVTEILGSLRV